MFNKFITNKIILIVLALMTSGVFLSCREECHYKPRSLAAAHFHSVDDGIDNQSPVDSFSLSGLGNEDSLLYYNRNNLRSINLPMNGSANETGFIFNFGEEIDTVWFSYKVIPWFISLECGFVLNFELFDTRYTTNRIDSVVILINEVTSFDDANIRIYH